MARGKKKVELSPEEQQKLSLERELQDVMDNLHLIPEPKFILEVGTPVRYGSHINPIVTNVLLDGKAYEITFSTEHTNYGRPYTTHGNKRIIDWLRIRKEADENTEQFSFRDDMKLHYSQRTFGDLFSKAYRFGIDFNPPYQRDHVWSLEDKIALIDSVFNNIDVGKFVYVRNEYVNETTPMFEILDGKQRATAILEFYEDKFKYRGKYFSELCTRDQDHFEDYNMSYAEIQYATLEQKIQIFVRLNTGGRIMSKEHLDKVKKMLDDLK
jgi:uncharacterized protein with ParB-like and HNH nuclease domain